MARAATGSWLSRFQSDFDSKVRKRGDDLDRFGAVLNIERCRIDERDVVAAVVQGSQQYDVVLTYDDESKSLLAVCECPYEMSFGGPCKHLWAVLRVAERKGLLPLLDDDAEPVLELVDPEEFGLAGGDDYIDGDYDDDGAAPTVIVESFVRSLPPPARSLPGRPSTGKPSKGPSWQPMIKQIHANLLEHIALGPPIESAAAGARDARVVYLVDVDACIRQDALVVLLRKRNRLAAGGWGAMKNLALGNRDIRALPDPDDRRILGLLADIRPIESRYGSYGSYGYRHSSYEQVPREVAVPVHAADHILALMCATGRCFMSRSAGRGAAEPTPLRWDDGPPWRFHLCLEQSSQKSSKTPRAVMRGELRRCDERLDLAAIDLMLAGAVVLHGGAAARLDDAGAFPWIWHLRQAGPINLPENQVDALLASVTAQPLLPPIDAAPSFGVTTIDLRPTPVLHFRKPKADGRASPIIAAALSFEYGKVSLAHDDARAVVYDAGRRALVRRDCGFECESVQALLDRGARMARAWVVPGTERAAFEVKPQLMPRISRELIDKGWKVLADGRLYRSAGPFSFEVRSGIDWFDLYGSVEFGDQRADLPALLAAVRRGETTVVLDDGTHGMVPEEWLTRFATFADAGEVGDYAVRFRRTQVVVLDALLESQPAVSLDEPFRRCRDAVKNFEGVTALDPSESFQGALREYQREGLGWLGFLQTIGFGGCLADDMGLGKTVQVLAHLERRRAQRPSANGKGPPADEPPRPSLIVVPRSLVSNWMQESVRFTPSLRVMDFSTVDRPSDAASAEAAMADHDVVLTTYGILRRDAVILKDVEFDYVILDEAQAIKNASTASAKAARLLCARHRLALSGTPIENHLGEIGSLFEFLSPGMMGRLALNGSTSSGSRGNGAAPADDHALLARALRPFILRRTKQQVAPELPPRIEQTLLCDLSAKHRREYDQLRDHYRRSLLARVNRQGLNRSKMYVLEALLRLRQAACHPGLIDNKRAKEQSAKLQTLQEQLDEVVGEGHKVLVFSQFTSLLAIVKRQLDRRGMPYEYLDGRTKDRAARIDRFQSEGGAGVFLISLKAGGLGLNLTAADYIYLLDPWWNPAVEQQAVDRAHRIGQTRPVFAYRIIARDTVEQHVLELQQSKRELVDAILGQSAGPLRALCREDLEFLLS